MLFAPEAFHINLADGLGARWTYGEPAVGADYFDAADGRVVARRVGQHGADGRARHVLKRHVLRSQGLEGGAPRVVQGGVRALVQGRAETLGQPGV